MQYRWLDILVIVHHSLDQSETTPLQVSTKILHSMFAIPSLQQQLHELQEGSYQGVRSLGMCGIYLKRVKDGFVWFWRVHE